MTVTWEQVVAEAIAQSVEAAEEQLRVIDDDGRRWTSGLRELDAIGLVITGIDGEPASLADTVCRHIDGSLSGLRSRIGHLDQLHFVLFGRTGAGKSSFVEALTGGDGVRISPEGRLDFTTEVDAVEWGAVQVVDTPGVEGWADEKDRDLIEQRAHAAVHRADVVVLVFDDYNQKIGEFEQVADWVAQFGKAAIAILNVRDDAWRYDARLWHPDDRESSVQQVREHSGHIERMLGNVGLGGIPLIAANLAWAFGGRADEIVRHPAVNELTAARASLGREELERISNFPAIVGLLVQLLSEDPAGIRLGALRREHDTALMLVAALLAREAAAAALRADQEERAVGNVLRRTGAPSDADISGTDWGADRASVGRLAQLLAEGPYDDLAGMLGDVPKLLDRHLTSPLTAARSRGFAAAQTMLQAKDGRLQSVSAEALSGAALAAANFDEVAQRHTEAALAQLAKDVAADAEDLLADFAWEVNDFQHGFDSGTGQGLRIAGSAVGFAAAGGAILAGALIASNPVGWAVGIGAVGGWLATKLRKSGRRKQTDARLRIEQELTSWLRDEAGQYRDHAGVQLRQLALLLAARAASDNAADAAKHRRVERLVLGVAADVAAARDRLADAPSADDLVSRAQRRVEEQQFPEDPAAGPKVWLGEDWLDELRPDTGHTARPLVRDRLGDDISVDPLSADAAVTFWSLARQVADAEASLRAAVEAGKAVLAAPPVIAFAGDFSSGKTTIIRRLAVALGIDVDEDRLAVGAAPTTTEVFEVPAAGFSLCDTPGLRSGDPTHDQMSRRAIAGASLIVMVYTPAAGRLDEIRDLLVDQGVRRDRRTVHVLGRIDGLSARPHLDPGGFIRLLAVKRQELANRLDGLAIRVHPDLPLPVAADPGGRHATRRQWALADFLPFRGWDGIDDLTSVVLREAEHGRAAAAIDRLITDLADVVAQLTTDHTMLDRRLRESQRLHDLYQRAVDDHERAETRAQTALVALVEDAIAERLDEFAEMSDGQLQKLLEAPDAWLVTDSLAAGFEHWRKDAIHGVEAVYVDLGKSVSARIGSRAFGETFSSDGNDPLADMLAGIAKDTFKAVAGPGDLGQGIAEVLARRIPALAGAAEQIGKVAARGAAVVVGFAIEGGMQWYEGRRHAGRNRKLEQARTAIHAAGADWVQESLAGTAEEPGLLAGVQQLRREHLDGPLERLADALDDQSTQRRGVEATVADAKRIIEEGARVLA